MLLFITSQISIVHGLMTLIMRKTAGGKTPLGVNRANTKFAKTFLSGPQVYIIISSIAITITITIIMTIIILSKHYQHNYQRN
jgi:hypothetical protein